ADVELIAAPPFSAGADAILLARQADAAVLAIRLRSTRESMGRQALAQLKDLGVPLLGLVLSDVGRMNEPRSATRTTPVRERRTQAPREGAAGNRNEAYALKELTSSRHDIGTQDDLGSGDDSEQVERPGARRLS